MSMILTYFYKPDAGGQNKKHPWVVAVRPDEWERVLRHRGLRREHQAYGRHMTEGEIDEEKTRLRHHVAKYTDLESLLDDEQRILGRGSRAYKKLELLLKLHKENYDKNRNQN